MFASEIDVVLAPKQQVVRHLEGAPVATIANLLPGRRLGRISGAHFGDVERLVAVAEYRVGII
jgi:hypothetical protein